MNTTAQTRTRPDRDLATLAIPVVAVTCFSVHVVLLVATGTTMLAMALSMLALSGLCVACAWRAGAHMVRDHLVVAAVGLTMIVVHLLLTPSGSAASGPGMDHAGMGHGGMDMGSRDGLLSTSVVDGLMQAGIALAAVQVVLAVGAVLRWSSRSDS